MAHRLVVLSSGKDSPAGLALKAHLSPLVNDGLIDYREISLASGGGAIIRSFRTLELLHSADIVVLLLSTEFVGGEDFWQVPVEQRYRRMEVRLVPVLLRPFDLQGSPLYQLLKDLPVLPKNRQPIATWEDQDQAWADVVQGIRNILEFGVVSSSAPSEPTRPAQVSAIPISDIFRTSGPPDISFVEPSQFFRLRALLDNLGPGLVVEGPSGVGKTTAVRKALGPDREQHWLRGGDPEDLPQLDQFLRSGFIGHLVVDDFHKLDDDRKGRLAIRMKYLADEEARTAKITVIGINPVGHSLTRGFPDLGGRFQIIKLDRQPDSKIAELILKGEHAANVRFLRRDEFINEADGSFFTAQRLCYEAALCAGVTESRKDHLDIEVGPLDVLEAIRDDLSFKYHDPLRALAAHDHEPPPRGACLALLWLLAQSKNGHVSLEEARYRYPQLADAFEWLRQSNLQTCFSHHPQLASLIYYNRAAAILSIEDPQLKFYLRKLSWEEFAQETGHSGVQLHPTDGLIFSKRGRTPSGPSPSHASVQPVADGRPTLSSQQTMRYVLHLSDLHFSDKDQATIWYAQLSQDLREQECEHLDAVIVSGDIANCSLPKEYTAARLFLEHLMGGFGLSPQRLVLVPGNHDVNWHLSQEAYTLHRRARYRDPLREGSYIPHGSDVVEVRDEDRYKARFLYFAQFYREINGTEYPLDYEDQATVHMLAEQGLLVLGLNSAWQIDHHFTARADVHPGALAIALTRIETEAPADLLRLAVWHHPLSSAEPDRIRDASFLQQLAKAGFRVALHGHIHRADNQLYRYDQAPEGRRIEIIGAGTFGAPVHEWVPGYPLQYNLLRLQGRTLWVETRCKEEVNGAWRPDARWLQGPGQDPAPRYQVDLGG